MIEEEGVIIETSGDVAKVAVMKKGACESCASSGVCHPGDEESYMEATNPLNAKKGQRVKVVLAPQLYLKASIILYGVPVTVFVTAAIIGKNLAEAFVPGSDSDLWAFLAGSVCMIVSFLFIKRYNKKVERTREYKPVIMEILG